MLFKEDVYGYRISQAESRTPISALLKFCPGIQSIYTVSKAPFVSTTCTFVLTTCLASKQPTGSKTDSECQNPRFGVMAGRLIFDIIKKIN